MWSCGGLERVCVCHRRCGAATRNTSLIGHRARFPRKRKTLPRGKYSNQSRASRVLTVHPSHHVTLSHFPPVTRQRSHSQLPSPIPISFCLLRHFNFGRLDKATVAFVIITQTMPPKITHNSTSGGTSTSGNGLEQRKPLSATLNLPLHSQSSNSLYELNSSNHHHPPRPA